jgi:hypothetical protein
MTASRNATPTFRSLTVDRQPCLKRLAVPLAPSPQPLM